MVKNNEVQPIHKADDRGKGMQAAISDDDFEQAIRELSDLPEIEDCWSLLIAESGKNRIDTLAQLLTLTSIVEREFSHICAVRQGYVRRVTRS